MPQGYVNAKVLPRIDDIPISWVFVDLGGVLADTHTAIIKHLDRPKLLEGPWPAGVTLEERLGLDKKYLFNLMVRECEAIWAQVKPYPWASQLLTSLRSPRMIVASSQWGTKVEKVMGDWVEKHLDGKCCDLINISHRFLLADRESLLIDDCSKNAARFNQRGGHSVVFPQPWNAESEKQIVPPKEVLGTVLSTIRRRYLCAAVPEDQARDLQYGQFTPEFA